MNKLVHRSLVLLAVAFPGTALAQVNGGSRYVPARPTVSPYINLVDNTSGLSNYQTLVRPLIEEREELNRQWTELERINQQMNGMAGAVRRPESGPMGTGKRSTAVRYMHYSHYFGTR